MTAFRKNNLQRSKFRFCADLQYYQTTLSLPYYKYNVKVKLALEQAIKSQTGSTGITPLFL